MAISRVKTWSSGEVLTASDLNAEFNNVLGNGSDLVSPFTKAISLGGFALNFDAANTIAATGTTSGVVLTGGTLREPTEDSLTAFATGGQTNATALSAAKKYHRISTCATAADSVKLPTSTAGQVHYIRNDGVASSQVFGTSPDTINSIATGTGIALPAGNGALFTCTTAGNWTASIGVQISTATAKGDLFVATASATVTRLGVGANGTIPMARSADSTGLAYVAALNKVIYGFTYANNGGDSIDVAAGGAIDVTGAYWITGSALTKSITVAWAVGNAQGGLDTGSVGNSDYYIWAICRSDTGVVDYLFSLSSTAPTMPTSYDFKRLIGWFKRVGGTNVAFTTYETEGGSLEMRWNAPTLDVNLANTLTTTRRTDAVKVPLNFSTISLLRVYMLDSSASFEANVTCPDETDAAPNHAAAPGCDIVQAATATGVSQTMMVRTSAAGLIAARATLATVDLYNVVTLGFRWARRN